MPMCELLYTGGSNPHCVMYCTTLTVFRHTDFPPAFGPDIINILFFSFSSILSGTTALP